MPLSLSLLRKWSEWYRMLRYRKGFTFVESLCYGLWLARV
jgi:hypothetical protein